MRSSDKDWLIRTDATPDVAAIFRQAQIALPSRAKQTLPSKPTLPKLRRRRGHPPRRSATPSYRPLSPSIDRNLDSFPSMLEVAILKTGVQVVPNRGWQF